MGILRQCGRGRGFAATEWRFEPGQIDRTPTELVPDVAFVNKERLLAVPQERVQMPPFSPDIAVEVRSPKDDLPYLREKIERYLATGAVLVLDVDPPTRTIIAHAHDGIREYVRAAQFRHDAVPWLVFELDEVFADLDVLERR